MRLLKREPNGELVLIDYTGKDVPAYAILSHTWAEDNSEEVSFQDVEAGTFKSKAGRQKIEFCAKQAVADGLQYFWIDTCCIDKRNAVELGTAINSMFRWYQKAARCYVYLSDVSKHENKGQVGQSGPAWEATFRRSRWFTRGWTLQELIAPTLVDFYSSEGERLGSKLSLEEIIHNITGISRNALRGDALSDFSIDERMSWAEHRNTTLDEDKTYCLLGIFDVSMSLIYGEGREKACRRLQQKVHKSYKGGVVNSSNYQSIWLTCVGTNFEQFAVRFNLSAIPEAAQFVAREKELGEMRRLLHSHSTRTTVILHGLGGIGKTQLAIEYVRRHKEKYTAIFWINANDEDSLKLSFRNIAQQVLKDHPSTCELASVDLEGDLDQIVHAVKAWLDLRENSRWLMIYDNYDNPRIPSNLDSSAVDLRRFLPGSDHGSVIITTRSSQVSQGQCIHIQKLPKIEEGLEILSNTSGRRDIEKGILLVICPCRFR
jgi:Heterokaryon incompatibility protein (HET)/NB-ARC domain